jgi:hypothetical protein
MTDVQQKTSSTASSPGERAAEMELSANRTGTGGRDSHLSGDRERCQDSLNALHHRRATALEGLQQIEADIEKATLASNGATGTKLSSLYQKKRALVTQLEEFDGQETILTRHLETIIEKERVSTVELHLTARRNAHHEGVVVADKLRAALGVVGGLYEKWREWSEIERRLKDTLRSLAPDRMTELPEFSYSTAMDARFQQAIGLALAELHGSLKELQRRSAA